MENEKTISKKAQQILSEIEVLSLAVDSRAGNRGLPIIGNKKAKVLIDVIKKTKPLKILEIGTLVGYSSILMKIYSKEKARIISCEINPLFMKVARTNIKRAGFEKKITIKLGDAKKTIKSLKGKFDMLFIDAIKTEYLDYLLLAERILSSNAIIVADNVGNAAKEMEDYLTYVRNSGKYKSKTYDFGFDAVEVSIRK